MALLGYWASQEQYSMQNLLEFVGQLTVQPENNEEPLLVEAEQLYEKILENITNKVVTNLSDNISFVSVFAQKELYVEQAFHPKF